MNGLSSRLTVVVAALNLGLLGWAQTNPSACETGPTDQTTPAPTAEVSLSTLTAPSGASPPTLAVGAKWLDRLYTAECQGEGFRSSLAVDLESTLGDGSVFGGGKLFVSGYHTRFPTALVEVPDLGLLPLRDTAKLQHLFALSGGVETDATFRNISLLTELGYAPLYTDFTGFSLGPSVPAAPWLDVGVFVQAGYTAALGEGVGAAQSETADASGALLRLKLGGRSGVPLPVTLPSVQAVRLEAEAWSWYDVLDNRLYGLFGGVLRLDITDEVSYNLITFKQGSAPPTFAPGTQFSTGLTIKF